MVNLDSDRLKVLDIYVNSLSLQENSVISSNANLGVYGQGLLQLTGKGDAIKAQRLSLSLFYNITVSCF